MRLGRSFLAPFLPHLWLRAVRFRGVGYNAPSRVTFWFFIFQSISEGEKGRLGLRVNVKYWNWLDM